MNKPLRARLEKVDLRGSHWEREDSEFIARPRVLRTRIRPDDASMWQPDSEGDEA